jgi:hypothetical protein
MRRCAGRRAAGVPEGAAAQAAEDEHAAEDQDERFLAFLRGRRGRRGRSRFTHDCQARSQREVLRWWIEQGECRRKAA